MKSFLPLFTEYQEVVLGIFQIFILSLLVYWVMRLMRHSRGLWQILGLLFSILSLILLFNILSMSPLELLFRQCLVMLPILVVIMYKDEFCSLLDRVGASVKAALTRPWTCRDVEVISSICASVEAMSKSHTGCLLVIENIVSLAELCTQGKQINAEICKGNCILETLFYKGTPLHDGGVVIQGNIIRAAACAFPLSKNPVGHQKLYGNAETFAASNVFGQETHANNRKVYGLRHQAAQGVSEKYTDALVIVVSEETGDIHYFHDGKMAPVRNGEKLRDYLGAELCHGEMEKCNYAERHPALFLRMMQALDKMIQRS